MFKAAIFSTFKLMQYLWNRKISIKIFQVFLKTVSDDFYDMQNFFGVIYTIGELTVNW